MIAAPVENYQDLVPVQLSGAELRFALEHDSEFFIQFFLGEELTMPVPEFHIDVFDSMISWQDKFYACALPRDFAKTTIAKLCCVWLFLFSPISFIVYLSNTINIAIPATNDIIMFMETENFQAVFGKIEWITRQDGRGYYVFRLGRKVFILRAMGIGQQVRGINVRHKRPQVAICDDMEGEDEIGDAQKHLQTKRWFYGSFLRALDKVHRKVVQIGNMIDQQSLIYMHCHSDFWKSKIYGCLLSDGSSLWPDMWPLDKLRQDFLQYQEAGMVDVWFAEMMNSPVKAGTAHLKASDIKYMHPVSRQEIQYCCATVDLAISKAETAHRTCIVVHGWTGTCWQAVDYRSYQGIDPIALFWEIVDLARVWHFHVCGIESVAYQASLQFVYPYMCGVHKIRALEFVALEAKGRKPERIISWFGWIKSGEYKFTHGDYMLTQEALNYRPEEADCPNDHIDAASYIQQMVHRFMHLIVNDMTGEPAAIEQSSYATVDF